MQICAHRGWTQTHVENTLAAIRESIQRGCTSVEFDVRRSRDGVWFVYHDADLVRLHQIPLIIAEQDASTLREKAQIPLLDEVLALFPNSCTPLVEVKESAPTAVETLAALVHEHRHHTDVQVICRGEEMPEALHRANDGIPIIFYTRDWERALQRDEAWIVGFDLPGYEVEGARSEEIIRQFDERNQKLAVWTINHTDDVELWRQRGAHWLITDTPWLFSGDGWQE